MPSVLEINEIDDLADHRLLWHALLPRTRNATFFQSLDWLVTYWKHFGDRQRLRVLVVSSAGETIGILPLAVRTETTRLGPIRVLGYPLDDWGTFYGPIGPNPTATLAVGMAYVQQTRRDWDLLDLRNVDASNCDFGRTPGAMRLAGMQPYKQAWGEGAVVETDGTWGEYWQSRTRKWCHNVRRCQRRLAELGEITHYRYRPKGRASDDADPRYDLFDDCCKVARASWQGSSTNGTTLCHHSVRDFLRELHAVAAGAGGLDTNLLLLDGEPIAFAYNYHYQGRVSALRVGFDPQYSGYGPGTVLQSLVLEDSFRRGDRLYDFGVGSLPWKRPWQTSVLTTYRYTHFPLPSARANLLRLKRLLESRIHGPEHPRYTVPA